MSHITIYRALNKNQERAVLVEVKNNGRTTSQWVNPRTMIGYATGFHPNRNFCIRSFAQGLHGVGHEVFLVDRHGATELICSKSIFELAHAAPEYYLLGLAWGLGEWDELAAQLRFIIPALRYQVVVRTGRFYQCLGGLPPFEPLALQLA